MQTDASQHPQPYKLMTVEQRRQLFEERIRVEPRDGEAWLALIEEAVVGLRKAGVTSLNFDLMYGLPGQDAVVLESTHKRALEIVPLELLKRHAGTDAD